MQKSHNVMFEDQNHEKQTNGHALQDPTSHSITILKYGLYCRASAFNVPRDHMIMPYNILQQNSLSTKGVAEIH